MADRGLHQLLVTRDGQLVGLLTRASVIQFLALHTGRT
jgi:signal-transduction protein with cAMP-binding, CBS, and nucleotidyltransferase domain